VTTGHDAFDRWHDRELVELLSDHGLAGLAERPFPTDGWSGATFSMVERRPDPWRVGGRFVLKRTSPALDWIAAATHDQTTREAVIADWLSGVDWAGLPPWPTAHLGAARDGEGAAIVMPDLSTELLAWERPGHDVVATPETVERVLLALASLHCDPWLSRLPDMRADDAAAFWCPIPERLTLTSRPSCARHIARGVPAGVESARKLLEGWDAFDRTAPAAARDLVAELSTDPTPLVGALDRLPSAGLHGDVKLANVAIWPDDDEVRFIDWQMTMRAPVAVELGWFLVANSAALPEAPEGLLERYRRAARVADAARMSSGSLQSSGHLDDWDAQVDLAWIVGLLLRGWRKGLDAEAAASLGSGVTGVDDLAFWCDRAVDAARRRL